MNANHEHCSMESQEDVWQLHLYVAGQTRKSVKAFANLHAICETYLEGKYHIEIIDLVKYPHLGRADQILAIPTLIRKFPLPYERIIGDLSNTDRVLAILSIHSK